MRVLVTRASADGQRTAARLRESGHEPILAPVIEIVATDAALPAEAWDAAILTSAHAAPMLARAADRRIPLFAVGARTAAAARAARFADVREAGGDAGSLARLIAAAIPASATLLHATTAHRKAEPEASLRAAGFELLAWECYEARAVTQLPEPAARALRTRHLDAVLHFSRRSAELLVGLTAGEGLLPLLWEVSHLCLSADVAVPLAGIGAETVVASQPNEEALVALLAELPR